MSEDEKREVRKEFQACVNMSASELERWLETGHSQEVGWTHEGEGESVGHQMGRRIVELRHTKTADFDDDDYAAMRKVIGYVHRHSKQRPKRDVTDTRWRYSLMNWGHDPLK